MRETYSAPKAPKIHSSRGRQKFIEDRMALDEAFATNIQPFIDRVNRSGAGLAMKIGEMDLAAKGRPVSFFLRTDRRHVLTGTLQGDMVWIYGVPWGGREDFRRLVPKLIRELVVMASEQALAGPPSAAVP